ncbi:MAG: GNAT family N-acetyltransferase [Treponema sp.]|nr:GNAT family N-acetyltransferase [Treponema sp.]
MEEDAIFTRAEHIRDVIRYIGRFKDAAVVIYLDDHIIDSPLWVNHIRDISLIHEAGLRVILVPGAYKHIDKILADNNIPWERKNGCRITTEEAMPLIKTAAFDVSNIVMTSLAGEHLTAVIGNWVRARAKGVIDGVDYGTSGEIDKIDDDTIRTVLSNGFIPIFPCIGWSLSGKPYNISSIQLASQIAVHIQADKLFFLVPDAELSAKYFTLPKGIGLSPEGCIPAMNLEEVDEFLNANKDKKTADQSLVKISSSDEKKTTDRSLDETQTALKEHILSIVRLGKTACTQGVTRVHVLNSSLNGTLPCEIFSDLGSGTMIYASNYGKLRPMERSDIAAVLTLIQPFVRKGLLLPRTEEQLENQLHDFVVYELDGGIRACSALHIYDNKQAEIAAVAVDETCAHIGIGPKIMDYLITRAKQLSLDSVFVLTTQTTDWFENLGFKSNDINTLPEKRKALWSPNRGSKLLRLKLK